jgi:hypothetical protein
MLANNEEPEIRRRMAESALIYYLKKLYEVYWFHSILWGEWLLMAKWEEKEKKRREEF